MDEGHRRFHSGRFGPPEEVQDFNMRNTGGASIQKQVSKTDDKDKEKPGKDDAGNTYKDQNTANEFTSQNKFMRD
jgi:hypothetical protein